MVKIQSKRDDNDRRFKLLPLPLDFPLRIVLFEGLNPGMNIPVLRFNTDDFPDGIVVEDVNFSIYHQGWLYLLYHENWPPIPLGETIPTIQEQMHCEVFIVGSDPTKHIASLGSVQSWRDLPSLLR